MRRAGNEGTGKRAEEVGGSTALREAQIKLDAVASPDDSPNPESLATHDVAFFDRVSSQDEVRAGSLGLHALAHQSGGQIILNASEEGETSPAKKAKS